MSQNPLASPAEMLDIAITTAEGKAKSRPLKSFLLGICAGAFIAIGFAFYITSQLGADKLPLGVAKLIGGVVFCTGLLLVILTGAELFTSSTLTLTAKASKRITWTQLLRNWLVVYLGNFVGALTIVALLFLAGTWESAKGSWGLSLLKIADYKCSHSLSEAFFLGILCNILVCLAVWLTYAGKTVSDKLLALILPIAMFVATGFEHSVANMFLIPFGLLLKGSAPTSFWAETGMSAGNFTHLTLSDFLIQNLLPVTLGNIVGGACVGLFTWLIWAKVAKH